MQVLVALFTPFDADGRLDLPRLRAHVLWLRALGVDGFLAHSEAGEGALMDAREREMSLRTVLDAAAGRAVYTTLDAGQPVVVPRQVAQARDMGLTGAALQGPPGPLVHDDELLAWYRAQGELWPGRLLAHHDPASARPALRQGDYAHLRAEGHLGGLLDSSGDLFRMHRLAQADSAALFSGHDRNLLAASRIPRLGGAVSLLANLWPKTVLELVQSRDIQLEALLLQRLAQLRRAGAVRAGKALLKMGIRSPMMSAPPSLLAELPAPELPE
jgi:4-hydroxy-tetrahydrodipicolinate synthase